MGHGGVERGLCPLSPILGWALVTAHHDFFESVPECAAAGLRIVAPDELAYPEHFGSAQFSAGRLAEAARCIVNGPFRACRN